MYSYIHSQLANFVAYRQFNQSQLEVAVLKDPYVTSSSYSKRKSSRRLTSVIETSGRLTRHSSAIPLNAAIRIIDESELVMQNAPSIGSGRFGTCYLATFSHYQVCVKVPKHCSTKYSFVNEANIMAKFSHCNLPYLFGFCTKNNSIVMSYHGIDKHTVSLHDVLYPSKSRSTSRELVQITSIDWMNILKQALHGRFTSKL